MKNSGIESLSWPQMKMRRSDTKSYTTCVTVAQTLMKTRLRNVLKFSTEILTKKSEERLTRC